MSKKSILIIEYKGYKQIAEVINESKYNRFDIKIIKGINKDEIIQINEDDDIIQNIHPTFTQLNKLGYKELEYYKTNSKTSYKVFLSDKNNVILYIDKKKAFFESSSKMNNYTGLKSDNYKNLESEFEWILKEGKIENNESEEEKVIRKKAEILVDLKLENKSLNLNKILSIIVSKNEKNIKEVLEKIDLTH